MEKVIFLDRDGTINVDNHYVFRAEQLILIPAAAAAIGRLRAAGFRIIVVSNQSAVGRGMATIADVEAANAQLQRLLVKEDSGAEIDNFLYCPHAPEDGCLCRKPETGMLGVLKTGRQIDFEESWIVGDKLSDLEFGARAGIPGKQRLLVRTGHGEEELQKLDASGQPAPRHCRSLAEAAELIISETSFVAPSPA